MLSNATRVIARSTGAVRSAGAANAAKRCIATTAASESYTAPVKDIKFLINDVYDVQKHYAGVKNIGGEGASEEIVDMVVEEMAKFAENELYPLSVVGDQVGCKHVDAHTVITPPGFKEAYDLFTESGWQGLSYPEHYGGQNLPYSLSLLGAEITATANFPWTMYPGLSKGAINTILLHGTEELKEKYLPRMVSGEWTGTMCLTEPQCGSDLAQVTTKAIPQEDGSYKVTGTKIFISCGEHDMTDNIIHCVLARLPDAPEGTRGISLFLVPKRKVDAEGTVGDLNGVNIGRIEDKMGCHGSSTCEINFEESEGYLIGTANRGLNHMFTFINTSRLGTAMQGVCAAEASYQNALPYAKERLAMRSLSGTKNPSGPADPIIVHPDVRRMLLTQKAIAEGGRSMVFECGLLNDVMMDAELAGDDKRAKHADDRMGFLTPILKGFLTESGIEAARMGIQVFGGHGYIKSNLQEQIARDVRISALWEGTTGIQSLDLLGRKIMLQGKLKPLFNHCNILYKKCFNLLTSGSSTNVKKHALKMLQKTAQWHALTVRIALKAKSNPDVIGVAAYDYLMFSGYTQLAYHWLLMEEAAASRVGKGGDDDFLRAKMQTSQFVFDHMLPRTSSHASAMMVPVDTLMGLKEDHFSFDY